MHAQAGKPTCGYSEIASARFCILELQEWDLSFQMAHRLLFDLGPIHARLEYRILFVVPLARFVGLAAARLWLVLAAHDSGDLPWSD